MSARSLLHLLAGLTLALALLIGWTSPGEAHAGHRAAVSGPAEAAEAPGVPDAVEAKTGDRAERPTSSAKPDCAGHAPGPDGSAGACCSNSCHAVMATDLGLPAALSAARTAAPGGPGTSAICGPSIHIKRPPRRPAALVG